MRRGYIRAGLNVNEPWVNPDTSGIEVAIIKEIAKQHNLKIKWFYDNESKLLESLHSFELDIVACGMNNKNPWAKEVGISKPYFVDIISIGSKNKHYTKDINGQKIYIKNNSGLTSLIKDEGGIPYFVDKLDSSKYFAAGSTLELRKLNFNIIKRIKKEKKILAVPLGENKWLNRVQITLNNKKTKEIVHEGY